MCSFSDSKVKNLKREEQERENTSDRCVDLTTAKRGRNDLRLVELARCYLVLRPGKAEKVFGEKMCGYLACQMEGKVGDVSI